MACLSVTAVMLCSELYDMGAKCSAQSGSDGARYWLDNHAKGRQTARNLRLSRSWHCLFAAHYVHANILPHLPQQGSAGKPRLSSAGRNLHGRKVGIWS